MIGHKPPPCLTCRRSFFCRRAESCETGGRAGIQGAGFAWHGRLDPIDSWTSAQFAPQIEHDTSLPRRRQSPAGADGDGSNARLLRDEREQRDEIRCHLRVSHTADGQLTTKSRAVWTHGLAGVINSALLCLGHALRCLLSSAYSSMQLIRL